MFRLCPAKAIHASKICAIFRPLSHVALHNDVKFEQNVPKHARVVIGGGGVVGCSVAYNLSKLGWNDVILLEQHKLTSGTTWHAAGLVGVARATSNESRLCIEGANLYSQLEQDTGLHSGYKRCGSVTVAQTTERIVLLQRQAAKLNSFGINAEIISLQDALDKYNAREELISKKGLQDQALWIPEDGSGSPTDLTLSLAAGARKRGVKIFEGVRLKQVVVEKNRVKGVELNGGSKIQCDVFVNCMGQWARQLGARNGVNIPLHSAEHFYVVTQPIRGVASTTPVLRDPDARIYAREWSGGLCVGCFEHKSKPIFSQGVPEDFAFSLLPDDQEHIIPMLEAAIERIPSFETAGIRQFLNGPESFTTDGHYILGEAPNISNYFVAAGFNSSGIASAGGAGKALAEWIIHGEQPTDLWSIDIRRFGHFHGNIPLLRDRTVEILGWHYAMRWPRMELKSCRKLRCSALYDRLVEKGARFGQKFGWERPNWFDPTNSSKDAKMVYGFSPQQFDWFKQSAREHIHTRSNVSIFDQSSFSKYLIQGPDALLYLQWLCSNNVDVAVGKVVYTTLLNRHGGIENDCTVSRLSEDEFFMVSSTAQTVRDLHWMRKNNYCVKTGRPKFFATITDITGSFSVLGIMGPKSRQLLQKASPFSDFSNEAFPFSTWQYIDIGYARVRAQRLTYVGELGWELYIPVESTMHVYDELYKLGSDFELKDAGYYAIESMRIEKGYRAWSHDITIDDNPLEAGLSFTLSWNKPGGFLGKEALLKQKEFGLKKKLFQFCSKDPLVVLWGEEPIMLNGKIVGSLTSAAYGHSLGCSVGMGYVKHEDIEDEEFEKRNFQIKVNGKLYDAQASVKSFFDPKSTRTRLGNTN